MPDLTIVCYNKTRIPLPELPTSKSLDKAGLVIQAFRYRHTASICVSEASSANKVFGCFGRFGCMCMQSHSW